MKKIIFGLCFALIAFSCEDVNDKFDDYGEYNKPTAVDAYVHTIVDSDFKFIVDALNGKKTAADSATAKKINSAKMFSDELSANDLIPHFLRNFYRGADPKSSAKITYKYNSGRDATVSKLTGAGYILSDADYKTVWGDPFVTALTPAKSPESKIPGILATRISGAKEGDFKNVEYGYSNDEPVTSVVESKLLFEDFEGHAAGSGVLVDLAGWINKDTKGAIGWQCRAYSNNNYAQVSSFNTKVENDVWLITDAANLTGANAPKFSFDIVAGNFNTNCLTILLSDNFDGNAANISTATWTNVTSSFTIPQPASGYSTWASAGTLNLNAYKGKKVHVAFRYEGDDLNLPKKTTTYQIDNVKFSDEIVGLSVDKKETQYAAYTFKESAWAKADNTILSFQPADYVWVGSSFITAANAPKYMHNWLTYKYPNGQEGDGKVVVYRTKANEYYADKVVKTQGVWTINSFIETITDQFVCILDENGNGDERKRWIFDPTIIVTMSKADYQKVTDYVKASSIPATNPTVIDSRGNAEFYFGFNAYYPNITYREVDRLKDNTYPVSETDAVKLAFMNTRTIEGLSTLLGVLYPDARPTISGIEQKAIIRDVRIYSDPTTGAPINAFWTYTLKCIEPKKWVLVEREAVDGRKEVVTK